MRMRQHSKNQSPTVQNNLRQTQPPSNIPSLESSGPSINGKPSYTKATRIIDQREVKHKRNEWRITKMVLAIFLSFVVCYLPITIAKIVDKDVSLPAFHIIGYILIYMSACINPIIYVIMNKQYRQAYKTVLLCKPSRLLSFRGSSANGKWFSLFKLPFFQNNNSKKLTIASISQFKNKSKHLSQISSLFHFNTFCTKYLILSNKILWLWWIAVSQTSC